MCHALCAAEPCIKNIKCRQINRNIFRYVILLLCILFHFNNNASKYSFTIKATNLTAV